MIPTFAVVGHPNKGKSSIVATLARDDSVAIDPQSGTTQVAERYTVQLGDSRLVLVDTPGFQRAAAVLAWLQQHATRVDERPAAVRQFVQDAQCRQKFPDEVQLLTPVVEGAAILYVVDGSRPFGPEYEAEMEILRWTGQPSMALINPIESSRHVTGWEQALGQYFRVVKVFNPMLADFPRQMAILDAFTHLREDWREPLERLMAAFAAERAGQPEAALTLLADLLVDLCRFQLSEPVSDPAAAQARKDSLEARFRQQLAAREATAHEALKTLFLHRHLSSDIDALPLEAPLFDTEKWIAWGLNRRQLALVATLTGAAAGATVDVALAGHSLMLGAVLGGAVAGAGVWLSADRLAAFRVSGSALGGFEARVGPVRERNFPYVVLSRFLALYGGLRTRSHARRDVLVIRAGDLAARLDSLSAAEQRAVHQAFDRLRRQQPVPALAVTLRPLLDPSAVDGSST